MTEIYKWECLHDKPKWEKLKLKPQWKKHPFATTLAYFLTGLGIVCQIGKFVLYFITLPFAFLNEWVRG